MTENNHRPVLIVIAGPNGSGKTSVTIKILHHEWLENSGLSAGYTVIPLPGNSGRGRGSDPSGHIAIFSMV